MKVPVFKIQLISCRLTIRIMTMEDIDDIEEEKICREKVTDNDEDDIDENDENDQGSNPNAAKTPVALLQVHVA